MDSAVTPTTARNHPQPFTTPVVSVVVPVRNGSRTLGQCLESIRASAFPSDGMQIIVSDNESTDDSVAVAAACGARVITCAARGVAAVRNAGARQAQGEVLVFIDADHTVGPHWIGHAVAILDEHPLIAAVGAPCSAPENGTWVQRIIDANRTPPLGLECVAWLGAGALAVRRTVFFRAGGFDESLEACEDVALCKSLRRIGATLAAENGLRTIHYGDPATLTALFLGELWRGRDNLRVSLRPPIALGELKGLVLTAAMLLSMGVGVVLLLSARWVGWDVALAAWSVVALVPIPRTARIVRRLSVKWLAKAYMVSLVYECARALALIVKVRHHRQRRASALLQPSATKP